MQSNYPDQKTAVAAHMNCIAFRFTGKRMKIKSRQIQVLWYFGSIQSLKLKSHLWDYFKDEKGLTYESPPKNPPRESVGGNSVEFMLLQTFWQPFRAPST